MLILFWLLVSQFQAQRALQWWYGRQAMQLCHEAEGIRNGLLQESFIMRRSLELSLIGSDDRAKQPEQDWLVQFDRLHHSLKELSDQLSPPYLDDSLPLAVQYVLESWKSRRGGCFAWELPTEWRYESYERSRVVLMALNELLRLMLTDGSAEASIAVCLHQQEDMGELKIQFSDFNQSVLARAAAKELAYLRRSFRFLTFGECFYRRVDRTLIWYFRWRTPSNNH